VLTIKLKRATRRITVRIGAPAVTATASLARAVRRHHEGRQIITLKIRDSAGNASLVKLKLRLS
jgi:hypothetical protein